MQKFLRIFWLVLLVGFPGASWAELDQAGIDQAKVKPVINDCQGHLPGRLVVQMVEPKSMQMGLLRMMNKRAYLKQVRTNSEE